MTRSEAAPGASAAPWFPAGRRLSVAVAGAATVGAATLTVLVIRHGGAPVGPDLAVHAVVSARAAEPVQRLAAAATMLGGGPVLYPLLVTLSLAQTVLRRSARELLPLLGLAAGQVLELLMFATLHRPTPLAAAAPLPTTTYASGHTTAAVLGWGLVVWQASRFGRSGRPRPWLLWPVALGAGLLVGATRVYLELRWLSDVLAGLGVGVALLTGAVLALARLTPAGPVPDRRARAAVGWLRVGAGAPAPGPGWRRAGHWLRTSPWAWCVPAVAALLPVGGMLAEPGDERMKDLLVYHGAGEWASTGRNVYAFQTELAMPFTYPPFGALVLEPLSRTPLGLLQALWTTATLAAVVALAATVLRPVAYRIGLPLTVAALLVTTPVRSHVRFGQVGVFLVLLVALDLVRRGRGRWRRGWGVGLAVATKLTPAVYLPWLAVTRQWRRLGETGLWLGGATVAGLVLLWPSSLAYLQGASTDTGRFGHNDIPGNQSIRGMLLRSLPEPTAERMWLALAALLAVVGVYQAWRCERAGHRLAAVGVLAASSVAVSPISWVHHLVWLALPVAALAAAGRWRLVAGWFAVLVVSFPVVGAALEPTLPALSALVTNLHGLTAVAAVLLLPALVRDLPDPAPGRGAPPAMPAR